jgi:hypothetical protein
MDEQQFLTPKDVLGYAEEYIVVEEIQELLNYSLSNSLDDIKNAVYARTGLNINLDYAYWQLNTNLSTSVKHLMNKHRVNYSMTTWDEEEERVKYLYVNMRVGDQWFLARFFANNNDNTFLDFEKFKCCTKVFKLLDNPDTAVNQIKDILR